MWFVPVGGLFAVTLFASNNAYRYSTVSFLQFMKEGNLVLTFVVSLLVGLQTSTGAKWIIISWVFMGSMLSVGGEVHFVYLGFVFQALSQLAECSRHVLGDYVMNRASLKLDPLTYVFFSAPSCLCFLLVGNYLTWTPGILARALEFKFLLIPNAFLAFLLNVTIASVIKEVSAVGFMLCGIFKDVVLVSLSAVFFGEHVTLVQACGFSVAISGVVMWSLLKADPDHVLVRMLVARLGDKREAAAINEKDEKEEAYSNQLESLEAAVEEMQPLIEGSKEL